MIDGYRLTIVRHVPNPDYQSQFELYRENRRYPNHFGDITAEPSRTIEERHLEVTVTAEEFAAIKRAVLEVV